MTSLPATNLPLCGNTAPLHYVQRLSVLLTRSIIFAGHINRGGESPFITFLYLLAITKLLHFYKIVPFLPSPLLLSMVLRTLKCPPPLHFNLSTTTVCLRVSLDFVDLYQLQFRLLRAPALAPTRDHLYYPISVLEPSRQRSPASHVGNERLRHVQNFTFSCFS